MYITFAMQNWASKTYAEHYRQIYRKSCKPTTQNGKYNSYLRSMYIKNWYILNYIKLKNPKHESPVSESK